MPKVYNNYNDTIQYTKYEENELPRNVKLFLRELRNGLVGGNLKFDEYLVYKSLLDVNDEEYEEDYDDLDLMYEMDAEEYAKGKIEFDSRYQIQSKFSHIADALGIDTWTIFPKVINKKEFAEKFLKDLKKYMKSTDVGENIHAIRFNANNSQDLEISIIFKRGFSQYTKTRNVAVEYLKSVGYENVRVSM